MSADSAARATLRQIPNRSEAQLQFLQSVGRGEAFYGIAWQTPSAKTLAESEQMGLTGTEGTGSHNWGSIHGAGSAGSFKHIDRHADGTLYVTDFKKYATDLEGAEDLDHQVMKRNVLAAVDAGDLHGAVLAMHANGYFELAPEKYAAAVLRNYSELTAGLKWEPLLDGKGSTATPVSAPASGGTIVAALVPAAVAVGFFWWLAK